MAFSGLGDETQTIHNKETLRRLFGNPHHDLILRQSNAELRDFVGRKIREIACIHPWHSKEVCRLSGFSIPSSDRISVKANRFLNDVKWEVISPREVFSNQIVGVLDR